MQSDKRKLRSISVVVLLLSILLISGFSWYAIDKQNTRNQQEAIKKIPERPAPPKPPLESPKPIADSTVLAKTDSVQSAQGITSDTNHTAIAKVHHPKKKKAVKDTPPTVVADDNKKTPTVTPAEESYPDWKIVVKKDMICVYPGKKWQNIFVVYPNAVSTKENKHIMKPDFPGVIYLDAVTGSIDLNSVVARVLIEKYTAGETFSKMPFFISLKFNPSFIIFGDYDDPRNQYILQDNKVSRYEAYPASDKMFSLNSK